MGLIQALVLGLIQGLTEFLPISSSGHLYLASFIPGFHDPGAGFTAVIQLGTIAAVLIYFWTDLVRIIGGWVRSFSDKSLKETPEARAGWAVFWGTIPVAVAGLLLESKIDKDFRTPLVVAGTLIGLSLLLWVADRMEKRNRTMETVTVKDGIVMGLWQCLALVPGSSRSGSTITGGLFSGFDRESAARLSFLLSVPAIVLSGLYKLFKDRHSLMEEGAMPTVVATVVAFASGLAAISFLMKYLQKKSLMPFVVYRVVLGLVVAALALSGSLGKKDTQARIAPHEIVQATKRA
ncbi:MAG: undecaprenyl-diphosphate phosphatase [Armatimonadetes bacterium]|nr:undecaprenyl-diphosphate phosphatase [Armatimonadota bacterium]